MKENKGFTLFELLISISIIGILTALAVVSFSSAQKKARDVRRLEDMKSIQNAAEQYYSTVGNYVYPAGIDIATNWTVNGQALLQAFPKDPKGVGWTGYSYTPGTGNVSYCACAFVENTNTANADNACDFNSANKQFYCVKNQQ